jgi:DSF synthase
MNPISSLFNSKARFTHTLHDPVARTYWCFMHRRDAEAMRPCFHPELMQEMRAAQRHVSAFEHAHSGIDPAFFVLASEAPVFNLGGDLELFAAAIRRGERESLRAYARLCVEGVHHYHEGFGPHVHSIALVQGQALGGGFEAALACNTIIAEESAIFGLPEVLFDLFPGMGAYPFLRRRSGGRVAQQLILSGRNYSAAQLHALGVVDEVVPDGEGVLAVEALVARSRKHPRTRLAVDRMRREGEPVRIDELYRIADQWVDAALGLSEKSLRTMLRFARAQERRYAAGTPEVATTAPVAVA